MGSPESLNPSCPRPVSRTRLVNTWARLAFLHWSYDPAVLAPLVPAPLALDTHEGRGWVSLVPFEMQGVRPSFLPTVPWLSRFAETNVRTYVVTPDGERSVLFFSLDAARLPIVAFARVAMGFPYVWSRMSISDEPGGDVTYRTLRRRWPARPAATSTVTVRPGDPCDDATEDPLVCFLTARWGACSVTGRRFRSAPVDHPVWRLRMAEVLRCDDGLVRAAGLPAPEDPQPVAHVAEPLEARFGPAKVLPLNARGR